MEPSLYKLIMARGLRSPLPAKGFPEANGEHFVRRFVRHIGRATIIDFSPLLQEAESHLENKLTRTIPQVPIPLPFDTIWMEWGLRKNGDGTCPRLLGIFCVAEQEAAHDELGPDHYKQKVSFFPISTSTEYLKPYIAGKVSVWLDEQYKPIRLTGGQSSGMYTRTTFSYGWADDCYGYGEKADELNVKISDGMRRLIKTQVSLGGYFGCYALRWINAMNIHLQKEKFSKRFSRSMEQKGKRRSGGYKYYVLTIDKVGRSIRSRLLGGSRERLTRLHLRRGHFKHFTKEKPMFGNPKLVGDFWWKPAVLGDAKNGVIDKDYRAKNKQ